MVPFASLWVSMLVAAVLVFFVSAALHMFLPIHKGDYRKLSGEAELMAAMRPHNLSPGTYMFPRADSMKEMAAPDMLEKFKQGPVGILTVLPTGIPTMGKSLVQWFVYGVVISVFVAYLASMALAPAAAPMLVFRFTATAALLAYGVPHFHDAIWKGQPWLTTFKYLFDGVIYSLVIGCTFTLLWPQP